MNPNDSQSVVNVPLVPLCLTRQAAIDYWSVKPSFFDEHVRPYLRSTKAGTSLLFLREAGVSETGRRDVLWRSAALITDHYTMAQIMELHEALEKISKPSGGWNKSLQALRAEAAAARKARAASPRN